ncbi:hypothetical protein QBL02_10815 [Leucobacter sp. UT-8R-CII-1-4]|uniref:hypothetical protein n=1 Tax=Leucobacter sp. UT-8R-CII-1-4 TaxID=3040075 RepID=UPI0024A8F7B3|nr:hypothetical protein [Leucobacter sp. UT-8R-CII-1-4]MDI6024036.1 hypothetical protein [Leucobacter sp. UT-8R-CII-1-4]
MDRLTALILLLVEMYTPRIRDLILLLDVEGPLAIDSPDVTVLLKRLTEMLDEGLICTELEDTTEYPDARRLRISSSGESELRNWFEKPYSPTPRVEKTTFSLRMLAAAAFAPHTALRTLETEVAFRNSQLELLTAQPTVVIDHPEPTESQRRARLLTETLHQGRIISIRNWIDVLTKMHFQLIHGSTNSADR